jgi:hypothetical protein
VPPWIRELIYAKDQQDSERRKRKRQASISESLPPIHITNVLPAGYSQDSAGCSTVSTPGTQAVGCHGFPVPILMVMSWLRLCLCAGHGYVYAHGSMRMLLQHLRSGDSPHLYLVLALVVQYHSCMCELT